jgi:hypothetical protein
LVERVLGTEQRPDGTVLVTAMVRMPPGVSTIRTAASNAGFADVRFEDGSTAVINFLDLPLPGGSVAQQNTRQRG